MKRSRANAAARSVFAVVAAARRRALPVQDGGRSDQRVGDRHRCVGAFRHGPPQGGLHPVRGRARAADHAFQRRTRAGEPRHRARHQRQHGRREVPRGGARHRSLHARAAVAGRRSVPDGLQRSGGADLRLDDRSRSRDAQSSRRLSARRHRDVRRGRRGDSARAARQASQEGHRGDLRRQRHQQRHRRARAALADSRDRGVDLRDRHRRQQPQPA